MKKLLSTLIIAASLTSCAVVNKTMSSWQGANYTSLIAKWGPPNAIYSDGNGGRVFVYVYTRAWIVPGYARADVTLTRIPNDYVDIFRVDWFSTYRPSYVDGYDATRTFFISCDGTVYRWSWRGL